MTQQLTKTIRAVYEHGVFRPLDPVELAEGAVVEISSASSAGTARDKYARFVGSIPREDIEEMNRIMEEEFGKVELDEWK